MTLNQNRQPAGVPTGGQFAASAKDEADVALDPADQPRETRHVNFFLEPTSGKDSYGNTISTGTFDDDRTIYDVTFSERHIRIEAAEHGIDLMMQASHRRALFTEADAHDYLDEAQRVVSERHGFQKAAAAWLSPTDGQQVLVDESISQIKAKGVLIGPFTRDNPMGLGPAALRDKPVLPVKLDAKGPTYTVADQDGWVEYYRGEDSTPLTPFERDALDREVARRLGEATQGANMPHLFTLLTLAQSHTEHEDREQGL